MGIQASSNSSSSAVWSNTYLQNCADDQQKKVGKSEETRREGTLESLVHSVSHDRFLGPLSKVLEFLTPKDFASFVYAKNWKVKGVLSNCTNFNYKQLEKALAIDPEFRSDNIWKLDLSCSEVTDDQLIDFISRFPKVRSLDLSRCHAITDKGIEQLGRLSLLFLDLTSCWKVTGEGAKHLKALPLKHLNLSKIRRNIQGILENISGLPLETLNLSGCFYTKAKDGHYDRIDWDAIELIGSFRQLKSLDLSDGTGLWNNLSHLRGLPLEYLNLSRCCELSNVDLRSLDRLKHLELSGCSSIFDLRSLPIECLNLSGASARMVRESNFGNLPLLSLDLSEIRMLNDVSFVTNFSVLKILDLSVLLIEDAALAALRDLRLEWLCLSHTQVTDAGLEHLSRMPLRSLDLRCCRITGKGVKHLKNLHSLESLVVCERCIGAQNTKPFETLGLKNLDLSRCSIDHMYGSCTLLSFLSPPQLNCLIQ